MKRTIGILALLVLFTFVGILIARLQRGPFPVTQSGIQPLSMITEEKTPAVASAKSLQPIEVPHTPTALPIVRIAPSSLAVAVGESFSLNIEVETKRLSRAFEFVVCFDPSIVQVTNVANGNFLSSTGTQVYAILPKIDNKQGEVLFAAVSLGNTPSVDTHDWGSEVLGTLEVIAVSPGITDFSLSRIKFVDEKLRLYNPLSLVGSSVSVHSPQQIVTPPQAPTPYAPFLDATSDFVAPTSPDPREMRLTKDGFESGPVWSPDGSKIVYRKFNDYPCIGCRVELWMMNADGSAQQKIASDGSDPTFSPDGQRLLYVVPTQTNEQELHIAEMKNDQTDGLVIEDQQIILTATTLRDARWIANNQIAFVRDDSIVMLDLTTHSERSINNLPPFINEVRTSYQVDSTGQKIAYHQDNILNVVDVASSSVVTITEYLYPWADSYEWSPDGQRLTYVALPGGPLPELWTIDADGNKAEMLASGRQEHFAEPRWSFDGKTIAFRRCPTGSNTANLCEIYLIDSDGSSLRRLTNNQLDERFLAWSPNGGMLAFTRVTFDHSNTPIGQTLWTIQIEGSSR